jgi:hypothetical protein
VDKDKNEEDRMKNEETGKRRAAPPVGFFILHS